jgi:biotin-dependent carboxylase-like uncharacterized protein
LLKILESGILTTVQDLGRNGHYHLGIPPSGAADRYSFQLGNLLLGNPVDYAGLEITLLGPKVEFMKRTVFNLTGAPVEAFLNNRPLPMWENIEARPGDILYFKFIKEGVRTYLCVSGGIQVPIVMDSRSTFTTCNLGGYKGRKLLAGDLIPIGEPLPGVLKQVGRRVNEEFIPEFKRKIDVRVVMGMISYSLSDEGVRSFLNGEWRVSVESNRLAYRLKGPPLHYENVETPFGAGSGFSNVVDTAYPLGGIMVTNSEEVIVLLNDATTGGGFMTIGAVISSDLDVIAQTRPDTIVRFMAVTVQQAIQERINKKEKLQKFAEMLK